MVGRAGKHDMPPDTDHQQSAISFQRLCEIVAKLRGPGGCPWDAEQTNKSLLPALIEEAYEAAGAGRGPPKPHDSRATSETAFSTATRVPTSTATLPVTRTP